MIWWNVPYNSKIPYCRFGGESLSYSLAQHTVVHSVWDTCTIEIVTCRRRGLTNIYDVTNSLKFV